MKYLLFLFLLPLVSAEVCVPASDVSAAATFCPGTVSLPNGIRVTGNDYTLHCSQTTIQGDYTGIGMTITGTNVTIDGCTIAQFDTGIALRDAEDIDTSTVQFVDVRNEAVETVTLELPVTVKDKTLRYVRGTDSVFTFPPSERPDGYTSLPPAPVSVDKRMEMHGDSSTVHVTVTATEDVHNMVLFEIVPKLYADDASLITFTPAFEVVNPDPEFKTFVPLLKLEHTFEYTYTIKDSSKVDPTNLPITIPVLEAVVEPVVVAETSPYIYILAAFAIIAVIVIYFFEKKLMK